VFFGLGVGNKILPEEKTLPGGGLWLATMWQGANCRVSGQYIPRGH